MNRELCKTFTNTCTRTIAAVVTVTAVLAAASPVIADGTAGQVWLISTRGAPRSLPNLAVRLDSAAGQIEYWRLQDDCRWLPADGDEFFRGDGGPLPTTIFVHGNRISQNAAISNGRRIRCQIERVAGGRPFRFVIWSWPSDRIRGRARRDARVKACRSDVQGYYLAECLRRVAPDVQVSLVGYSFGARVITGALHLLAGGQVAGRSLAQPTQTPPDAAQQVPPRRAVLVAAALDADWLSSGRRNGLALSQVESLLVTRNSRDPVLKWYPLMYCRGGPQALGFTGPAGCPPAEKIELLNLSCSVGRVHDWARYVAAAGLRRRLAWYTFLDPPEPQPASKTAVLPGVSAQ